MLISEIDLDIAGIGLIIYSEAELPNISIGSDFLQSQFMTEDQIFHFLQLGKLMGISTGTPGFFLIKCFIVDSADETNSHSSEFIAHGYVFVSDQSVCIRDLYDLMEWQAELNERQKVNLPNGHYHVVVTSRTPETGILGDNQVVHIYFIKKNSVHVLDFTGIPAIC